MINCFLNQEGTGGEANTDGSKPHLLRDGLKGKERTEQLILLGKDFTEDQWKSESVSCSVVSNSMRPHEL